MPIARARFLPLLILLVAVGGLAAWAAWRVTRSRDAALPGAGVARRPVPVEVVPITRGPIQDRRTFSGTLIGNTEFVVAPRVGGRVERLHVDIGDPIAPGAVIVELDDAEFEQAVAEANAELEVARASVAAARAALDTAESEHARVRELRQRQIASGAELDLAAAQERARQAELEVVEAGVQRATAALEAARIRLRYAVVDARWSEEKSMVVARRWVDVGATVGANSPLVTVVDFTPVLAVLHVTEREHARIEPGQVAVVRTDAYPGEAFAGRVVRIAPVFAETSRQARIEVEVPNADRRLKPGMFARVEVVLDQAADATVVPLAALVRRDGSDGVFVVERAVAADRVDDGSNGGGAEPAGPAAPTLVRFVPVRRSIVAGESVQIVATSGPEPTGLVVTLGQQLIQDGSPVRPVEPASR